MRISGLLGTDEPGYPPPDAALRRAAAGWLARIDYHRLRGLVEQIPGPRNRVGAPKAMAQTDALLLDAWRAAGWRTGRQRVRLWNRPALAYGRGERTSGRDRSEVYPELNGANLVAIAEGESDEAILVVAHHDTVRGSPGADDNGAGLAALLELASLFEGRRFHRTVILAAPDFEEIGLVGSRYLVSWLRRRYRVRGAVVYDPIGYMNPATGSQRVPSGIDLLYPGQIERLAQRGNPGDTVVTLYRRVSLGLVSEWARCLAASIGSERVLLLRDPLDLPVIGPALFALPVARNFSRSDHVRFWQRGLPAIQVTNTANFRNPNYHRPTDTPATLDYVTLAAIVAATALLVERLADGGR